MKLMKLQQDRAATKTRMDAIHGKGVTEDRMLTNEELAEFNTEKAKLAQLDANIAIAKEQAEAERGAPAIVAVVGDNNAAKRPWNSLGEQLQAVAEFATTKGHKRDERLFAAIGANETVDAEGGFLVQPEFSAELLKRAFASGTIASRCRTVPMSSSRLVMNGIDDSSRAAGGRFAGIAVYRVGEAQKYTKSTLKFRRVELNANKMIGMFYATDELLEDAGALMTQVTEFFPEAFGWQIDNEVLNGTGKGEFLGVNNSGVTVVVPKDSGQASNTYSTQNFINMKARLAPGSRGKAVFLVGPDFEPAVTQLTIGTGTAVELLYKQPGTNGVTGPYGKILGIDVIPVEQTAALSTQGDVLLADFSQYIIGERSGLRFDTSIHVAFDTGEQAFRWQLRNDGQPLWDKPLTLNNSTNKVSPFVTLQAR